MREAKYLFLLCFFIIGLAGSCTVMRELWEPADVLAILQKEMDKIPPEVTITSPTNGQEVGAAYQITGTVSDTGSGVKAVYVSVDNQDWQSTELSGNTWTATLNVSEYGAHTNMVYAEDQKGNKSGMKSVWIDRVCLPSIVIISPANATVTNITNVTLSGTADVDSPHSVNLVQVQLNGGAWTDADGTNSWSKDLTLVEGTNTVYARAVTEEGKIGVSVEWRVILELSVPVVTITSPANGALTGKSAITIGGTASVDAPYSVDLIQVQLNGGAWTNATGTTSWSNSLTLVEGSNTIVARAIADSGKTNTSAVWNVFYGTVVYVSLTGNDTNSGTLGAPIYSLPAAVVQAQSLGITNIRVESGTYIRGAGLNVSVNGVLITNINGLKISGGYNSGFSAQTGFSVLSGADSLYHVVMVENATNIVFDGLVITRGKANGTGNNQHGGGLYVRYSSFVEITNCTVSNNYAVAQGGGIVIEYGTNHTVNGIIDGNMAEYGGGLYIYSVDECVLNATVINNTADNYGGGLYMGVGSSNTLSGIISSNYAVNNGGGVYIYGGTGYLLDGTICSNYGNYQGGGVHISSGTGHNLSGTISDNTCAQSGGGLYINAGSGHNLSGTISRNLVTLYNGGGLFINGGSGHTVGGTISGNAATNGNGGGIYLNNTATAHTFTATIKSNTQYGVYKYGTSNPTLTGVTWGSGAETNAPANEGP